MAKSKSVVKAPVGPECLVQPEQVLKATKALLTHIKKTASSESVTEKRDLLADDEVSSALPVWLTMSTKMHLKDSKKLQPSKIPLPNALNTDPESTICIVRLTPCRCISCYLLTVPSRWWLTHNALTRTS